jgi:hypothetical protein
MKITARKVRKVESILILIQIKIEEIRIERGQVNNSLGASAIYLSSLGTFVSNS